MKTVQIFLVLKIVIVLAFLALLSQVSTIWLPLAVSLVLTFGMLPLVRLVERVPLPGKKKIPRVVSIFVSFVILCIALIGIAVYVLTPLVAQVTLLISGMPQYAAKAEKIFDGLYAEYQSVQMPDIIRDKAIAALNDFASILVGLAGSAAKFAFSLTSSIFSLILVPFLTYYFLKDGNNTRDFIVSLFPAAARQKTAAVMSELSAVMIDYIKGQIIISAIIGVLVTVGAWVIGLDYPLVFGLLAMLLETIPYIGPICAAIPALLLGYLISPLVFGKVLVFYIIVHQLEANVVVPNVMGKTVNIHPGILMIALLIGGELYGIIGMMLAVPATAILRIVLRAIWFYGEE